MYAPRGAWVKVTANSKPRPKNVINVQHVIKIYQALPLLRFSRHYYCVGRGSAWFQAMNALKTMDQYTHSGCFPSSVLMAFLVAITQIVEMLVCKLCVSFWIVTHTLLRIEYKDNFFPVLEKFRYHKGSSFEECNTVNTEVCGMPPIQEDAFNHTQFSTIKGTISSHYPMESYTVQY